MTCECKVEKYPLPEECKECHQMRPVDYYKIIHCPTHRDVERYKRALEKIEDFKMIPEFPFKSSHCQSMTNIAQQALRKDNDTK